jgi:hypothetical protein
MDFQTQHVFGKVFQNTIQQYL